MKRGLHDSNAVPRTSGTTHTLLSLGKTACTQIIFIILKLCVEWVRVFCVVWHVMRVGTCMSLCVFFPVHYLCEMCLCGCVSPLSLNGVLCVSARMLEF